MMDIERVLRDPVMDKMARLTKYDPALHNRDDRGEMKSLAYMAVEGLPYLAAHE